MALQVSVEDRIKSGIEKLRVAIKDQNIILFNSCIGTFCKMQKLSRAAEVLVECPTDFILAAQPDIPIYSEKLGRHIVLGKQIRWDQIMGALREGRSVDELIQICAA